jgi:hypothetical protein
MVLDYYIAGCGLAKRAGIDDPQCPQRLAFQGAAAQPGAT